MRNEFNYAFGIKQLLGKNRPRKKEKYSDKQSKSAQYIKLLVLFIFLLPAISQACELKFNISGEKKDVYKAGDELIVEVMIVYTHRTCELQLS